MDLTVEARLVLELQRMVNRAQRRIEAKLGYPIAAFDRLVAEATMGEDEVSDAEIARLLALWGKEAPNGDTAGA